MAFVSAAPATQPGANQSSLAWEHEVPTSGLLMLIAVACGGDGADFMETTTPTVGGVPATPVPDSLLTRDDSIGYGLRVWYVLDPATTEGVASVAFAPGQNMFAPVGVSLLYGDVGGVDGANVETAIISGNPVSSALEVASEVGGMVADFVQFHWHEAGREPAPTGDNAGNQHADAISFASNTATRLRASSAPGAATVNMDWANAGGTMSLMHVAVPLTPASSGGTTESITGEFVTSTFSFAGEVSNTGTTEAATAELAFGASVGADVIDVFISAASEFATSAFSWLGSAVTGLSTFVSATFSWGTSLSAPRPTLLQRVTAGLEWGVRFIGTAAGVPTVVESAHELVQTGAAFVRSGTRMIGNALRSIIRRY